MKMVASAKLMKAQQAISGMLPYQKALLNMLNRFLLSIDKASLSSSLLQNRDVKRVVVVAVASNDSLCGAFNVNMAKLLGQVVGEYESTLNRERVEVIPIGRKMEQASRKLNHEPADDLSRLIEHPDYANASMLASGLMQRFERGDIDRVEILYQHFKSTSAQVITRETLLPFPFDENKGGNENQQGEDEIDYIIEPSREELLTRLLPKAVRLRLFTALLDSRAAEQAARLMAMQVATDNADDLLWQLNIDYNEQRQESITNELLDIIGGSFK